MWPVSDSASAPGKVFGMKRWLINLGVLLYAGALCFGIGCHTLKTGTGLHCAMYFVVWDMFCGWTSYSCRVHVIGEGESGRYYELAPGPWGEIRPFGRLGRRHYDVTGLHSLRLARNTLRHTDHEPMTRMFVVEEYWNKKFNLPDHLWHRRFDEPRQRQTYFSVRHVMDNEGRLVQSAHSWLEQQYQHSVGDNPRLAAEAKGAQPFLAINSGANRSGVYASATLNPRPSAPPVGSRLGN